MDQQQEYKVEEPKNNLSEIPQFHNAQTTQQALDEALAQNSILRARLIELEALYEASKQLINEKNKIILEMAEELEKYTDNKDESQDAKQQQNNIQVEQIQLKAKKNGRIRSPVQQKKQVKAVKIQRNSKRIKKRATVKK